ncbi:MAG: type II toxin-antitoxin system VapC family toxin [Schwartzia sp.]|nr:type II toxin-antitoxin system VapC family toxin [Schwartzia sp. (in: firmicutes)]
MIYLIDTHILLWALYDSRQLSDTAKIVIQSQKCSLSIASLWEIAIKVSIGKLKVKQSIQEIFDACLINGIEIIGISPIYCDEMIKLPKIHNDPFDRLIVATAKAENYTILTKDATIPKYGVKTIW